MQSEKVHPNTGKIPWNKGLKGAYRASIATRQLLSERRKGNQYAKGVIHSAEWKDAQSDRLKQEWKNGKRTINLGSGEKHWNWKGGVTPENKRIRSTKAYMEWRTSVFERDDYTCQLCGDRGCYIEADHIKPFSKYPDLRFNVSNGRTLCAECHKSTDTYFWKISH